MATEIASLEMFILISHIYFTIFPDLVVSNSLIKVLICYSVYEVFKCR